MHSDPELLSLLALGEQEGTDADHAHLRDCDACRRELVELTRMVSLCRGVYSPAGLSQPDPRVWERIRAELAFEPTAAQPVARSDPSQLPSLRVVIEAARADDPVARATLEPVGSAWTGASGEAVLATDELGRRILQLAVRAELPETGVRQAWLVHHDDPRQMRVLGVLDGPYGVWTLDRSIDLREYAFVDVSQQDPDQSEHSGQTIVRGRLVLTD